MYLNYVLHFPLQLHFGWILVSGLDALTIFSVYPTPCTVPYPPIPFETNAQARISKATGVTERNEL